MRLRDVLHQRQSHSAAAPALGVAPSDPIELVEDPRLLVERDADPFVRDLEAVVAAAEGVKLQHVKPHGELFNVAARDPELAQAIVRAVAAFDPTATIRYAMLDTQVAEAMLQERLMARLSAIFGGVALLLAIVGLYGVVSYSVASRRAEIGVRVALGASRPRILSMVLADVGRIMVIGVAAGGVLALASGRAIGSLLFGLEPDDVLSLATSAGVLLIAGLLSAAWPARRATGIDPVTALREN